VFSRGKKGKHIYSYERLMAELCKPLNPVSAQNPNIYYTVEVPTAIPPLNYITNQRGPE
jgi:hypothetical protein